MSPIAGYLVETSVTLAGVVALAWVLLVGGRRLGMARKTGPLELVSKLPIDPRRAIYLVRAGSTVYVIGGSEGGLVRFGEMRAEEANPVGFVHAPTDFRAALARVLGRGGRVDGSPSAEPRGAKDTQDGGSAARSPRSEGES